MTLAKIVAKQVDPTTGAEIKTRVVNPTRATVTTNGTRATDVGEFVLPITAKVGQNDLISYIQDVADSESLVSIYNFKQSARDEGGFDLDGNDRTFTASFVKETAWRFDDHYCIEFNAVNEEVTIPHTELHDFTGRFDVIIQYKADTIPYMGSTQDKIQVMFSKYDSGGSGNGVQIGLKYNVGFGWGAWANIKVGGTATELWDSDTTVSAVTTRPNSIRFTRDGDNLCKLYVGTTLVASTTVSGSADGALMDTVIGSDNAGGLDYDGRMYQLRIYNSSLPDATAEKVINAKPQWTTMKIRGKVWKIKENTSHKTISIRSINQILFKTKLNKVKLDAGAPSFGELTTTRVLNIFEGTENTDNIIHDILGKIDENILFKSGAGGGGVNVARYLATGILLKNLEILTIMDQNSFWMNARQVFITEDPQASTIRFENAIGYKITTGGKDDSTTVNDLEVFGSNALKSEVETTSSGVTTFDCNFSPLNVKIKKIKTGTITAFATHLAGAAVKCTDIGHGLISGDEIFIRNHDHYTGLWEVQSIDSDNFYINTAWVAAGSSSFYTVKTDTPMIEGTDFDVEIDKKRITFTPALATTVETAQVTYDYEDPATIVSRKLGTNIAGIGAYSRTLILPQIPEINNLNTFTNNFVSGTDVGRETINQRYRIEAPLLVNSIRENIKPTVINPIKSINTTPKISSITYKYPQMTTIIEAGEHLFDSFDLQKRLVENDESAADGQLKTKNV